MSKKIEGNAEKEMSLDSAVIAYFEAMEVVIINKRGAQAAQALEKPFPAEDIMQEQTLKAEKAYNVILKYTVNQLIKPDETRSLVEFLQQEFDSKDPYIASFIRRGGNLQDFLYKLTIDVGSILIKRSRAASEALGEDPATEVLKNKMASLVDEVIMARAE